MHELIFTHFPYCIKHLGNNKYIVLNRDYKPLGITDWVEDYATHPSVATLKITRKQAAQMSYNNSDNLESIFLFDKTTDLLENKKLFSEYLNRLEILAHIKTKK